jgi:hypothetical protein
VTAPSYEQLAALVAAQARTIAQLQDRLAVQDARLAAQDARIVEQDAHIAALERQLAFSLRGTRRSRRRATGWTSRRPSRCAAGPGASPAGSQGTRAARCGRSSSPRRWWCTSRRLRRLRKRAVRR